MNGYTIRGAHLGGKDFGFSSDTALTPMTLSAMLKSPRKGPRPITTINIISNFIFVGYTSSDVHNGGDDTASVARRHAAPLVL